MQQSTDLQQYQVKNSQDQKHDIENENSHDDYSPSSSFSSSSRRFKFDYMNTITSKFSSTLRRRGRRGKSGISTNERREEIMVSSSSTTTSSTASSTTTSFPSSSFVSLISTRSHSSSSDKYNQKKKNSGGDSNGNCVGGDDGADGADGSDGAAVVSRTLINSTTSTTTSTFVNKSCMWIILLSLFVLSLNTEGAGARLQDNDKQHNQDDYYYYDHKRRHTNYHASPPPPPPPPPTSYHHSSSTHRCYRHYTNRTTRISSSSYYSGIISFQIPYIFMSKNESISMFAYPSKDLEEYYHERYNDEGEKENMHQEEHEYEQEENEHANEQEEQQHEEEEINHEEDVEGESKYYNEYEQVEHEYDNEEEEHEHDNEEDEYEYEQEEHEDDNEHEQHEYDNDQEEYVEGESKYHNEYEQEEHEYDNEEEEQQQHEEEEINHEEDVEGESKYYNEYEQVEHEYDNEEEQQQQQHEEEEEYIDDYILYQDDTLKSYFAFDDDGIRHQHCKRTAWHRNHKPNCNFFHEEIIMNMMNDDGNGNIIVGDDSDGDGDDYIPMFSYLASGDYRDVFRIRHKLVQYNDEYGVVENDEEIVAKLGTYTKNYDDELLEMIRIDALVMEQMSTSKRILDIYGHCGTSVSVAYLNGPRLSKVINKSPTVLNPQEKFKIGLEMAKAIADLHGHDGGPIVNGDIQYLQWLLDESNNVVLADFNRAEPMLWDEESKEFCKYAVGGGLGNVRAPEEFIEQYVDESIDVYSYGMALFTLLTGEEAYWSEGIYDIKEAMINGQKPKFDSRIRLKSEEEKILASVMDACIEHDSIKRIDIFQAISMLEEYSHIDHTSLRNKTFNDFINEPEDEDLYDYEDYEDYEDYVDYGDCSSEEDEIVHDKNDTPHDDGDHATHAHDELRI